VDGEEFAGPFQEFGEQVVEVEAGQSGVGDRLEPAKFLRVVGRCPATAH
jgi:hypothetical protein